jgi:PTH1 family peptidyl-tRNA hydrolase
MKLIVGLGNPGRRYEQTRHNIGFMVAAKVAAVIHADTVKSRFEGEVAEGLAGEKLVVLCPQTYMNASGKSVRKACDFYKLSPDDVLVICDDLDLPPGRLRFRPGGSAGGQKGLADIIRHLGTDQIARLRIGIGRPPQGWQAADYVLGKFTSGEQPEVEQAIARAAAGAVDWSVHGIGYVMNRYNADPGASTKRVNKERVSKERDNKKQVEKEQGKRSDNGGSDTRGSTGDPAKSEPSREGKSR